VPALSAQRSAVQRRAELMKRAARAKARAASPLQG
jgi:chorismate mutase